MFIRIVIILKYFKYINISEKSNFILYQKDKKTKV